ncbi:MAG: hypothetical protein MjAS7_1980 [Metallosphaera javensis (ex Sakai et al. 2022)]|nr:MAG: hypothetical protein MjAS7_1980 [Metallosphaera javensis (ex Sakai et al. 2022)]
MFIYGCKMFQTLKGSLQTPLTLWNVKIVLSNAFQTLKGSLQTHNLADIRDTRLVVSNPQRISTNTTIFIHPLRRKFVSNPQRISTNSYLSLSY